MATSQLPFAMGRHLPAMSEEQTANLTLAVADADGLSTTATVTVTVRATAQ